MKSMEKKKTNISLLAAAKVRQSGLFLSVKRGVQELGQLRPVKKEISPMPKAQRPLTVSVIICTSGRWKGLRDAAASALKENSGGEVLVVWNRPDGNPEALLPSGVRWVRESKPGLSFARNRGAACAKGEFLLYMDDDAVAGTGFASQIKDAFLRRPKAAVIGGQIYLPLPSPVPEAVLPGHEGLWSAYTVSFRQYRTVHEQYAFPYGACFAVRSSALHAVGGFPENYGRVGTGFEGGEETALCFLMRQRGWEIGVQPSAWVEHRVDPRRFTREHIKNTLRAGIFTTFRLCRDGYAPWNWDSAYLKKRMLLAAQELSRLRRKGTEMECFYKKCERDAFAELWLAVSNKNTAAEGSALC